ncbi:MAG: TraV family lipoprotein [Pseudomonadota bacterium]
MIGKRLLSFSAISLLAGCGTTTVFDDWSCDTPTGRCSTVAEVDADATAAATGTLNGFPPTVKLAEGASPPKTLSAPSLRTPPNDDPSPTRTPDVVARIVFAPFTDGAGIYHGRAVVHAVMEDGAWAVPKKDGGQDGF